jgi:hypothetical protein
MTILAIPGLIGALISYAVLILQVYAFVHCLLQRTEAFPAAGKWTKPGWAVVTGLAIPLTYFTGSLSLFGIAFLVASIVYLVDVRPAVREVSGGRGGQGRDTGRW